MPLAALDAFRATQLIVPACHDTASAIAAIPTSLASAAYISSGTWSLVGTLTGSAVTTREAFDAGYTNLGAASGDFLLHSLVNSMWVLKQCMDGWAAEGRGWKIEELIEKASVCETSGTLNMDAEALLLDSKMPERINAELQRAGNQTIRLVHRQHHRAEIIRLQHRLARLGRAQTFFAAQRMKAPDEIFRILALGGIDDADAFERNFQRGGNFLHLGLVAEHDGRAKPQRIKLPRGLQDARLVALGKHDALGMPLQLFNDIADETHGRRLAANGEIAKSICRRARIDLDENGGYAPHFNARYD